MTDQYYKDLHKKSFNNRKFIEDSKKCGCFYCGRIFAASEIEERHYIMERDGGQTATCPYCSIDSVIGDNNGTNVTDELLDKMREIYF